jgi:hypothetical protein
LRRLAVIPPRRFHLRLVRDLHQAEVIGGVLRRHGDVIGKIAQKPGGPRCQIAGGDHRQRAGRKVHCGGAPQSAAICPENIDAQGGIGVDERKDDFAWRGERMNVAKQEAAA